MNLRCLFGHDWIAKVWPDHVSLRCGRHRCDVIVSAEFDGERRWVVAGEESLRAIDMGAWVALIQNPDDTIVQGM